MIDLAANETISHPLIRISCSFVTYLSLLSFTALTSLEKSNSMTHFFFKSSQTITKMKQDTK